MIRVFLVCDEVAFCEKLRAFFNSQDDFQVCGKTAQSTAAIQKANKLLPDLAVLVVDGVHNLKIADDFKRLMPHLPLFLMTTVPSVEIEKKALAHGVDVVFSVEDDFATLALNAREVCPEKQVANDVSSCVVAAAHIRFS
jgi:DNA-binding NarL/FixJ family response regulator